MSFVDHAQRDLRLQLLRLLLEAGDETANSFVLTIALEALGFRATRDQVRGEIEWLREQRLVALFETGGPVVATITERGHNVAKGLSMHPGVAPFVPGS